jgi:hypothetical protein
MRSSAECVHVMAILCVMHAWVQHKDERERVSLDTVLPTCVATLQTLDAHRQVSL